MKNPARVLILTLALSVGGSANAISDGTWADISDVTVATLLGTALLTPTFKADWEGLRQATYSIVVSQAVTQGLKAAIDAERPDMSGNDSFPSGHATFAFSSATTLHRRYGWKVGFPAYGVATLTGIARHEAQKHRWRDVGAAMVIGVAAGWIFTDRFNEKVKLTPWVADDGKGGGMIVSMDW